MKTSYLAIMLMLVLASCSTMREARNSPLVTFGVWEEINGTNSPMRETNTIPWRNKESGLRFGYSFEPQDEDAYAIYDVLYLPSTPKVFSGDISNTPPSEAVNGVKTPTYQVQGRHKMVYWIDDGDPEGEHRIDIFMNDKLVRSIKFTIIREDGPQPAGGAYFLPEAVKKSAHP